MHCNRPDYLENRFSRVNKNVRYLEKLLKDPNETEKKDLSESLSRAKKELITLKFIIKANERANKKDLEETVY